MVKRISRDASDVEFWVRLLVGALERNGEHGTMTPRGYGLVVERVLAKDETGVRFSLSAQNKASRGYFWCRYPLSRHAICTQVQFVSKGDNRVDYVDKGQVRCCCFYSRSPKYR